MWFFCETHYCVWDWCLLHNIFLPWKDFPFLLGLSEETINLQMLLVRVSGPFLSLLQSLKQIILCFGSAQWPEKMSFSDCFKGSQGNGRCVGRSACPGLFGQWRSHSVVTVSAVHTAGVTSLGPSGQWCRLYHGMKKWSCSSKRKQPRGAFTT